MRSYERSGVTVDQCAECRGIFLDRGELERLVDAENRFYNPAEPARADTRHSGARHGEPRGDERRYDDGYSHGRRKRGGFLSDLFD